MLHFLHRLRLHRVGTMATSAVAGALFLAAPAAGAAPLRDGQHDFDYLIGSWKIHLKRLVRSADGTEQWVDLDGTVKCRTVFDGRAEVEEFKVASADGKMVIDGLALRFYNPASRQWSIWWANAKDGSMSPPPVIGSFKDGRGEFYDQEIVDGQAVFTRYVWTRTDTPSPHFEQSISSDGGRTWKLWWVTDQTKTP